MYNAIAERSADNTTPNFGATARTVARDTTGTSAPPIMVAEQSQDKPDFPPAIFGRVPKDFDLAGTDIHALGFWLRKAMAAVDDLDPEAGNEALGQAMDPVNRVFEAIKCLSPTSPSGVALQLKAISDFAEWHYRSTDAEPYDGPIEELSAAEFRHLATTLSVAVKCDDPTKSVGPLTKGRSLTRAGLLHRYQAFLVGELETLSWNLYGSRDYAMRHRPNDRAVSIRVSNRYSEEPNASRRKVYPFFDEAKLSARARAVLESLDIDTARDEDAAERRKGHADAP